MIVKQIYISVLLVFAFIRIVSLFSAKTVNAFIASLISLVAVLVAIMCVWSL